MNNDTEVQPIKQKISSLGTGLSALISEATVRYVTGNNSSENDMVYLPISKIIFNSAQPRKIIDHEEINNLSQSISEYGVLQPILVKKLDEETYQIIVGERRYHAAKKAGLTEIPAIIKNICDSEILEIAIIENVQRQNLTALEEANAYRTLLDSYGHTQESIAQKIGKSRSYIANTVRLLRLPETVRELISMNKITPGHARVLVNADNPMELARSIIENNLNVRETERLINKINNSNKTKNTQKSSNDAHSSNKNEFDYDNTEFQMIEKQLSANLNMDVKVKNAKPCCVVTIKCNNMNDLDTVMIKLGHND